MKREPSVTARVIREELELEFIGASIFTLDATYSLVDDDFIDAWEKRYEDSILETNGGVWDPMFDCEDYVELAKVEAKKMHMRKRIDGIIGGQGIAIGLLCFHQRGDVKRGHAVCLIRKETGWIAWDPTKRGLFELSDLERQSAFLALF